jgi:hypothetical protein
MPHLFTGAGKFCWQINGTTQSEALKCTIATGGSIAEDIRLNEIKTKPKTSDKTISGKKVNTDGSVTLTYSDGTEEVVGGPLQS